MDSEDALSFLEMDCLFVPLYFLKVQWEGDGDTDPRTDMKYHLSALHWSPGLPRLILSPQSQHSGADPRSLPLPTLPQPPFLSIPWKWGQRGEEARMNRRPPWQVKCVFHVFLFHVPLPASSSWSLSARSANTRDPKPHSVPSPRPACVLRAHL